MARIYKKILSYAVMYTAALLIPVSAVHSQVVRMEQKDQPFVTRWEQAMKHGRKNYGKDTWWAGWCIEKMMHENSFTGSWQGRKNKPSLQELLYGVAPEKTDEGLSEAEIIRREARKALSDINNDGRSSRKVMKKLAFLMRFNKEGRIIDITLSNLSLPVDLENAPLVWCGLAPHKESLDLLEQLYSSVTSSDVQKDMVAAVGVHTPCPQSFSFLRRVLESNADDDVREAGAFWLGQQNTKEALAELKKTAFKDKSSDVRGKAVFSISQIDLDKTADVLMELARKSNDREVREKAVFWMGQRNDPRVLAFLKEIALSGTKLGEKAVFAVSQMKNEKALDLLIDLAKSGKNRDIREKAIFWLGQKASEKSKKALHDVIQSESDYTLQKQAVFSISQLPPDESVPALIKIAKTHPDYNIRKKAIFWLGQTGDKRAVDFLVQQIKSTR